MTFVRKLILSTAAAATLVGAAAPAAARPWGWGGPRYYGHWHRGGDVGGALVGGLLLGGIIGAVAASDHGARGYDRPQPPSAQDRAADACAAAVEDDRHAPINRINAVDWFDEGWHVTGVVNGGEVDSRPDSFSCTFRYGQVEGIRYGSEYAPRG